MRITARLSMHADVSPPLVNKKMLDPLLVRGLFSFHGCDITLKKIDQTGFVADFEGRIIPESVVQLKLPGAGMIVARVVNSRKGHLHCAFVNPVTPKRLSQAFGLRAVA
jgi:hypothetical protein